MAQVQVVFVRMGLAFLLALAGAPDSGAQNGSTFVTIVDDIAPASWSDSRGHYCPSGWREIEETLMCKHVSTFNRLSPNHQRALEDVHVIAMGGSCPAAYQKLGDTICGKFVTLSASDIYTLTADIVFGGAYDNGGEGAHSSAPRCNRGWDLVSHPYQGGIGMCVRRITVLVQAPA